VVVGEHRSRQTRGRAQVPTTGTQVAPGRHRGIVDVGRVGDAVPVAVGSPDPPRTRDELHRADRTVPHRVAVEPAAVGVVDGGHAAPAAEHGAQDRAQRLAGGGDRAVTRMIGFDLADTGQHGPTQVAAGVGGVHLGGRALIGAQYPGRNPGGRAIHRGGDAAERTRPGRPERPAVGRVAVVAGGRITGTDLPGSATTCLAVADDTEQRAAGGQRGAGRWLRSQQRGHRNRSGAGSRWHLGTDGGLPVADPVVTGERHRQGLGCRPGQRATGRAHSVGVPLVCHSRRPTGIAGRAGLSGNRGDHSGGDSGRQQSHADPGDVAGPGCAHSTTPHARDALRDASLRLPGDANPSR